MQSTQTMEMTPKTAPGLNFWADKIAPSGNHNAESSNNCRSKKIDFKDQILLLDKQRPQPKNQLLKMAQVARQDVN